MNTIIYTVLLIAAPFLTVIIWLIIGAPRVRTPKVWRPSAEVDRLLSAGEPELDESERAIS